MQVDGNFVAMPSRTRPFDRLELAGIAALAMSILLAGYLLSLLWT
jgi:hypothetical protein